MDFVAFVNFFGKRDGLVHVSQLANERVNHPKDVLKEGQEVNRSLTNGIISISSCLVTIKNLKYSRPLQALRLSV